MIGSSFFYLNKTSVIRPHSCLLDFVNTVTVDAKDLCFLRLQEAKFYLLK